MMIRTLVHYSVYAGALGLVMMSTGCVRRTIRITTEPPNALVFLNDQEIGRSEVATDFLWYGDYDVIIRKKGYADAEVGPWRAGQTDAAATLEPVAAPIKSAVA